ncbi:unnamed protein product [Parascedosporium putredinis]|uniref:Helicase C-terminal domain-containing protein n=1 Tax=Parascedosporium putredinis TaxID=1442378 RepID=A0A9P1H6D1_9PEZI|nr:unnamed protein product [Parascedosporium putredinis]CAI7997913.1 unnamed protein product [Parascedosporium putredinis]
MLYPYQRRSAAVMLEKESNPGQSMDPRLESVFDQEGRVWYYDKSAGAVLKEPRYYDGVSGGILAEEMGAGKTIICLSLILATKHLYPLAPDVYRGAAPVRPKVGSLVDMAASFITRNSVPWEYHLRSAGDQYDLDFSKCIEAIKRHPGQYLCPKDPPAETTRVTLRGRGRGRQGFNLEPGKLEHTTIYLSKATVIIVPNNLVTQWRQEIDKHTDGLKVLTISRSLDLGKDGFLEIRELLDYDIILFAQTRCPNSTRGAASLASSEPGPNQSEAQDLERIGAMAALYLKVRPWANTITEPGDTPADWAVYVMQPQHSSKSRGRTDSLRLTLSSLIVRHQVAEIGKLLPSVDEKVVILDGSYQDNIKDDLQKAIETAESFLEKKDVTISEEDDALLRQAIAFGHVAMANEIRTSSNQFHEIPLHVSAFPGSAGFAWSLNNKNEEPTLTNAPMLFALQKMVRKHVNSPSALNRLLNGGLVEEGIKQRSKALSTEESESTQAGPRQAVLAGNAKLGDNRSPRKGRVLSSLETIQSEMNQVSEISNTADEHGIPVSLAQTMVTATGSAKLSYLIDAIAKYQEDEQIIVFYDNENIAWYIASLLDVLQITYLIYAKSLTTEKKAQYVNSFNHSPTFRVLLMDITQAAFGLDMWAASRIYFMSPVLNPQVEAQAVGRARRISQQKPVSVETLVLRDSIDEVIVSRRQNMTQAEHRKVKSILDDRPIYNWILNAKVLPLVDATTDDVSQMAPLQAPQLVFGKGFGRMASSDEGLMVGKPPITAGDSHTHMGGVKRPLTPDSGDADANLDGHDLPARPARRLGAITGPAD